MKIHNPPMQFKTPETRQQWDDGLAKNSDPYGNAVYRFASEWATRMEAGMLADGVDTAFDAAVAKWIKANADAQVSAADDEGITGFMFGCAMSMLSACWKHGEQLRRWHNLETQLGDEGEKANESGGVLNPAILNIG